MKIAVAVLAVLAVGLGTAPSSHAQTWPQKPIRMIVPFPPGGGNDLMARLVAKPLAERLGQPVVVDNRGGANGIIGMQQLKQAAADGYTIAVASDGPIAINPAKGLGPAVAGLLAGDVQFLLSPVQIVSEHIRAGKLIALGTGERAGAKLHTLPDLPAIAETVPGFEIYSWIGVIAPANTPPEIIDRLAREIRAIVQQEDFSAQIRAQGAIPEPLGTTEFVAFVRRESEKWVGVAKANNIRAE